MADDNPQGPKDDSDAGKKPATEKHEIAAAINSLEAKYESAQQHRPEHDDQVLSWTRRTAKGVFVYTALTFGITIAAICSAFYSRQSLRLTREIFIADQRPIIWLTDQTDLKDTVGITASGKIGWNWEYTNYGRSPAVRVHFETYMSLDGGAFIRDFDGELAAAAPIPPGKKDFATVYSKTIPTSADFMAWMAINNGVSISGIIKYDDVGGHPYQTAFCLGHLQNGQITYRSQSTDCQNDIK